MVSGNAVTAINNMQNVQGESSLLGLAMAALIISAVAVLTTILVKGVLR